MVTKKVREEYIHVYIYIYITVYICIYTYYVPGNQLTSFLVGTGNILGS